jgi:site-specific DNA-methyltransferase (adenine-specific)
VSEPYAQGKRWTLYAGDCLTLRHLIPADASLVTDNPYGMSWDTDTTRFSGGDSAASRYRGQGRDDWPEIEGDDTPFDPAPWLDYPRVVLWGYHHFAQRLPVGTILVWVKRSPENYGTFLSDAELGWAKGGHGVYCHEQQFPPPARSKENGYPAGGPRLQVAHPTQKPVALMEWSMERAKVPAGGVVADPYCGSGSTGVAVLRRGGTFIGIEKNPEHLATAARRLGSAEAGGVQGALSFGAA